MNSSVLKTIKNSKVDFKNIEDLQPIIDKIKDKKVVMLGEASHGTHEYYQWRAKISRKLIEEHDFNFVSVEGDWPACYQLNRHIKNYKDSEESTYDVLKHFQRWPSWMWANWEVHEFANWMKSFNDNKGVNKRAGFYGLDVYSLWESLDAIIDYLQKEDPEALKTAKRAIECFEPHRDDDGQQYAYSTRLVPEGCSKEVREMLAEIVSKAPVYNSDPEHAFSTEQNAHVAKNAESYYRVMIQGGQSTWNLRDRHMMETLNRLLDFHGKDSKAIVWAHNTHIGDASYTDMADQGLYNIGELAREEIGEENVTLIGFGSYEGSVNAGRAWGAKVQEMELPKARKDSWEAICNEGGEQFFVFSDDLKSEQALRKSVPHRAVGVVYHPDREQFGNYVPTVITKRYDAFVFINQTVGLHEMDVKAELEEMPATYPFGL